MEDRKRPESRRKRERAWRGAGEEEERKKKKRKKGWKLKSRENGVVPEAASVIPYRPDTGQDCLLQNMAPGSAGGAPGRAAGLLRGQLRLHGPVIGLTADGRWESASFPSCHQP